MPVPEVILGRVEANCAWVPGDYKPPAGATNDSGDLLEAMRAFGEAFTARHAGQVARSQDLMAEARAVLGHAGIQLVLALLQAGRIPYPDAPWWPAFLSELVRSEPGEPRYVALPQNPPRPRSEPVTPSGPDLSKPGALADEMRAMGLM